MYYTLYSTKTHGQVNFIVFLLYTTNGWVNFILHTAVHNIKVDSWITEALVCHKIDYTVNRNAS